MDTPPETATRIGWSQLYGKRRINVSINDNNYLFIQGSSITAVTECQLNLFWSYQEERDANNPKNYLPPRTRLTTTNKLACVAGGIVRFRVVELICSNC